MAQPHIAPRAQVHASKGSLRRRTSLLGYLLVAPAMLLVMGLILPYRDYWRPWLPVGSADHNIQHDPAFEWLFEVDVESGQY